MKYLLILTACLISYIFLHFWGKRKIEKIEAKNPRKQYEKKLGAQRKAITQTLRNYLQEHDCLCEWEQFGYWCGKPHGLGWHDGLQNNLVHQAVKLPMFIRQGKELFLGGEKSELKCTKCGNKWIHTSEEWRMLAYRETMVLVGESSEYTRFGNLVGDDLMRTDGFTPFKTHKMLSLPEWQRFMHDNT